MIPHFLALDVGVKISQAQLCTYIRDCHATFLVKNTLFKGEVAWQPLKELQICSSSILDPPTTAFKWDIVCLSTIITFEDTSTYVKKCPFLLYKINIFWHNHLLLSSFECHSRWVQKLEEQICSSFRSCHATSPLKSVFFTRKVAWQPLIKVHSWAWDILTPTSKAKNEVSFVYVAQVVLTQIYFKAKSGNGGIINYYRECNQLHLRFDIGSIH